MRTRQSICVKKNSYRSENEALVLVRRSGWQLRAYRCDRCRLVHL